MNPIGQAASQVGDEHLSRIGIAPSNSPAWRQFRIGINRGPGPGISRVTLFGDLRRDPFLLAIAKRPHLITLHPLRPKVSERGILEFRTNCTKLHKELVDVPSDPLYNFVEMTILFVPQSVVWPYGRRPGRERNILDLNTNAFRIVQSLTGDHEPSTRSEAARAAGRRGVPARAKILSPERRKEIALIANVSRWKDKGN